MDYKSYFDWVAGRDRQARRWQKSFHRQLIDLHRFHIPEGASVLEWGCGRGGLLKSLNPGRGLGLDISPAMIKEAQAGPGNCEFFCGDAQSTPVAEKFEAIIACYLAGYLTDIQAALENMRACAAPRTRLYISSLNTPWRPLLRLGELLGAAVKQPPSNWLSRHDLLNLLNLSGWEAVTVATEQIIPFNLPGITPFLNRFLIRLPFFRHLGMTLFIIARPRLKPRIEREISCSVIVPVRNEAGNIRPALARIPVLGRKTEIIFVEGNSRDNTWEAVQKETAAYQGPHKISCCRQPGKGKWDAVSAGFARARGDVLVIQDGDLTAPPEDLPKFYAAIASGEAEFANGSRLVYPMESQAMRFLNLLGNKFFALALSYVLGQPVKDSLCGTKMLLRADYERLLRRIRPFGNFDPFGDFNLLFGAALLGLRIRDIPLRYKDRAYGATNISRFRHGWLLMRMTWFGLRHIRFHPLRPAPQSPETPF